jgi:aspartyl-tRNA(Asn)/glutamyl-tRNA(Gln) amidotransferase subunit A
MDKIPETIKEIQRGLSEKRFSAVDLVDKYLGRIQKNKDLNAFITVCEEGAYRKAKEVDKLIADSDRNIFSDFPLLGVCVGHKDLFSTKGIRTTAASKVLTGYIPPYSATVVEKIDKAGAIMLGKTNCDAWAHGTSGENSDFGPTKNPWDKRYVPGGSSSGSAAAVSAGLSLAATGTDTGGSVRQPSSFCGIAGLKPTYGVVSRYGVVAMASSLDSIGCMAQKVADVESIFNVMAGEDGRDSSVKNVEFLKPKDKMKIGIPKEYFVGGVDKEVERSVYDASKIFEKEGVELTEISLPLTKYAISVYYIIQPAEVSSNLGRYDGIRYGGKRSDFGAEAVRRIMLGTYVLSEGYYDAYYLKAQKVRSKLINDFDKAFGKVDAIIAPVSPTAAFKLGEKVSDPLKMYLADIFTASANLAGIPGLAIPSGFNKEGLPLGFQLMGQKYSEPILFSLGKMYQEVTGYKPKLAIA